MTDRGATITHVGHLGDGIGHAGGETVRVPMTAPGDTVARGPDGVWRLDMAGDKRALPPCPHYGLCGGCNLQHLSAESYGASKRDWVAESLARQGLEEVGVAPLQILAPGTRRRAGLSFVWDGGHVRLGFHEAKSDKVFGVAECPVLDPAIVGRLTDFSDLIMRLVPRGRKGHLTVTRYAEGFDIDLTTDEPLQVRPLREADIDALKAAGVARLSVGEETLVQFAAPALRFAAAIVNPPPGAFLQATEPSERALREAVAQILGPARKVADLFAGIGTFSFGLAEGKSVVAYEGDTKSVAALMEAAARTPDLHLSAETRDLQRRPLTVKELSAFDGVVLDPPRVGAEPQILQIAKSSVPVLAYVSCFPQSFARDARLLAEGGYALKSVQPIDQFLWSSHVELVAAFTREAGKGKRPFHPRRKRSSVS